MEKIYRYNNKTFEVCRVIKVTPWYSGDVIFLEDGTSVCRPHWKNTWQMLGSEFLYGITSGALINKIIEDERIY